jgi:hypothetical protein
MLGLQAVRKSNGRQTLRLHLARLETVLKLLGKSDASNNFALARCERDGYLFLRRFVNVV